MRRYGSLINMNPSGLKNLLGWKTIFAELFFSKQFRVLRSFDFLLSSNFSYRSAGFADTITIRIPVLNIWAAMYDSVQVLLHVQSWAEVFRQNWTK